MSDMAALVTVFMVVLIYLALIVLGIASYVMTSYSLYTIAKRRQIKNPWLAWIPVATDWTIGSIADDYDGQNGMKRKWRVVLITIDIIYLLVFFVSYAVMIVNLIIFTFRLENSYIEPPIEEFMGIMIPLYLIVVIAMVGSLTVTICRCICLYKIYESTVPEKAVKYLLLSLLVPMANAICLMRCKDKGYSKSSLQIDVSGYKINPVEATQQNQ